MKAAENQQVSTQADEAGLPTPFYALAAVSASQLGTGWDVINANEDAKTWLATSDTNSPTKYCATSGWTSSNGLDQDDYLLAPAVHLEAGKAYKICYNWKAGGSSDKENYAVYLSTSKEVEEIQASTKLVEYLDISQTTFIKEIIDYTPEADGDYYVVFHCFSGKYKTGVKIADLLIAEDQFAPSGVTGLTATPGADHELSCELTWTLPTTDSFGSEIPEDKPITAVKIYRDGEEIENTNLDGTATSFTDNEATGLTSGYHTYGVSVIADGVESAITEVGPTTYIGPVEPFSIPANLTISSKNDLDLWTAVNDTKEWTYNTSYPLGAQYIASGVADGAINNWLITPPVKVEEAGYYRLSVTAFTTSTGLSAEQNSFEVCLLNSTDVETATKAEITTDWQVGQAYANTTSVKPVVSFDFKVTEPGDYYIGFHNISTKSNYTTYYFYNATVEKSTFVPGVVTDLKAEPAENFDNAINISWTNPTTSLSGDEINTSDYQVEIYLNDEETPATTVDGDQTSATVNVAKAGVYTVTVKTVATDADHSTAPTAPSVTSKWVGSHEVELPYETTFTQEDTTVSIWDIVDGNNDGITFVHYTPYASTHNMSFSKSNLEFNDYVLSPSFELKAGSYYQVTATQTGSSSRPAQPILGVVKANTFGDEDVEMVKSVDIELDKYTVVTDLIFAVETDGLYQIVYGLNQTFTSNYSSLSLDGLSVKETVLYPGDVTNLTATISGDNNDSVELAWTNPSVCYNSDITLTAISQVEILRDGEAIHTISEDLTPGAAASYTDTEVPGGIHTYSVKVLDAEGNAHEGTFPSITTQWVGGGQSAPIDYVNGEFPEEWTTLDLDDVHNDTNGNYTWKQKSNYYIIDGHNYTNDDYLVSSPIKINKNEIYQITYSIAPVMDGNSDDIQLAVKMGSHKAAANTYEKVHTISLPSDADRYTYVNHTFHLAVGTTGEYVASTSSNGIMTLADDETDPEGLYNQAAKVPAAGDYNIALHHTDKGGMRVKEFHMEKVANFDPTTSIVNVELAGVSFDGTAVHFEGTADVTVYDMTGAIVAQGAGVEGAFAISGIASGYYVVNVVNATAKHTLKIVIK